MKLFVLWCLLVAVAFSWAGTKEMSPFYAGPWTTLDGKTVTLFRDNRPVLMDFWASWCVACRMATPHVTAIAHDFPVIRVLGVNVDEGDLTDAHKFVEITHMGYPSIVDIPDRLTDPLQVQGLPTFVLFDGKGHIVKRWLGEPDDLEEQVRLALHLP